MPKSLKIKGNKNIPSKTAGLIAFAVSGILLFLLFSGGAGSPSSRNIVIGFFTHNGYGNNLYLDNIRTGVQLNEDVKVTALVNLPYDTTYSRLPSGSDTIAPIVGISNLGRLANSDSIEVYLKIDPIGYLDSTKIAPLASGVSTTVTLKQVNYPIGVPMYIRAYCYYPSDSNRVNDTLRQFSIVLPGVQRSVLFEEFTSNSSPACANNNNFLNSFVNNNFQTLCAIKYHTGLLGTDSFYIANPEENDARRRYYFASSVPLTLADGKLRLTIPYGDTINMYNPFSARKNKGTPVSISVANQTVSPGTIRATATISILSSMKPGNYRLRFNAVERFRNDTLQGTNGESNFYDIFRDLIPDTNGISIATGVGTNQYSVTYNIDPDWDSSMIYTVAYVQNDADREIMNCAKSRNIPAPGVYSGREVIYAKADLLEPAQGQREVIGSQSDSIQTSLTAELFESFFPPIGWSVFNRDGFITFDQFSGANGPSIGGTKSVTMNFYDYNIIGQKDSMYSASFTQLLNSDTLRFDYAYAQYNASLIDSLVVKVSTDGGLSFPFEVFRRGGLQLATAPQTTSFFVPQNNTQWRAYSVSLGGIVSAGSSVSEIPLAFSLFQNYPNPFNPSTSIRFSLPVNAHVSLTVYDMAGRIVASLADGMFPAGNHSAKFDGAGLSSGVYFCRMETDGFSSSVKLVLVK